MAAVPAWKGRGDEKGDACSDWIEKGGGRKTADECVEMNGERKEKAGGDGAQDSDVRGSGNDAEGLHDGVAARGDGDAKKAD